MAKKTTTVESALRLAKYHAAKGNVEKAQHFYSMVLAKYPQNKTARKGLKTLQNKDIMGSWPDFGQQEVELAQQEISDLITLYSAGKLDEALKEAKRLSQINPKVPLLHNILGAIHSGLGKVDASITSYKRALELNPGYAEAHYNLGRAFSDLGQLDAAVASCERALNLAKTGPNTPHNKGVKESQPELGQQKSDLTRQEINDLIALYSAGKLNEALREGKRLSQINPKVALLHNTLGAIHAGLGKPNAAVASYKRALELKPDYAEAHCNLGSALRDLGQLNDAVASCERALEIKPDYAEAHYNLGNALRDLGQLGAAVASYERALEIKPDYAEAHCNLGSVSGDLGQLDAAVASCEQALKFKPDLTEAHSNLGNALWGLGQLDDAVASCEQALEINPDYPEAHNNLGNALRDLGQLEDAVASYGRALEINPDYPEAHSNLGNTLRDLGQLNDAVASCERALEIKPDYAEAHNNLGSASGDLGQMDAAVASYGRALEIKPDYATAHYNLSLLKKYEPDDSQINLMESLLSRSDIREPDRIRVCFALGKASDDLGDYERSIHYLNEGNSLRKQELNYNIAQDKQLIFRIKEIFSAEKPLFDVARPAKHSSIKPVFILGMPRSGTSLVEQILATHTQVHGSGELEAMNKLLNPILSPSPDQAVDQCKIQVTQNDINTLRDDYLETLTALKIPEKIITDKMPLNFYYIGFIVSAFPEAKVIHLNRDPRATCWSIYKTYFSTQGNGYAYDLDDLAEFYSLYIELMSFWRARFPNRICDIDYQDLTENQEEETRKLLEFCGLKWERGCLDFHKTERVVKTASATQVRQKMYKGSSEAWKKYEAHLQPLIKALGY